MGQNIVKMRRSDCSHWKILKLDNLIGQMTTDRWVDCLMARRLSRILNYILMTLSSPFHSESVNIIISSNLATVLRSDGRANWPIRPLIEMRKFEECLQYVLDKGGRLLEKIINHENTMSLIRGRKKTRKAWVITCQHKNQEWNNLKYFINK